MVVLRIASMISSVPFALKAVTLGVALGFLGVWVYPMLVGNFEVRVAGLGFLTLILVATYMLLLRAGLPSLCHVTFYALGAYTSAILLVDYDFPHLALTVPLGGLVAAAVAFAIGYPMVRARGAYFFLATFALLGTFEGLLSHFRGFTGGDRGLASIPSPVDGILNNYYMVASLAVVVVGIVYLIGRSRFGRQLAAVGQSENLADSLGIDATMRRFQVFILASFMAGVAGAFFASFIRIITPQTFGVQKSIDVLMATVIGGLDNIFGPLMGTLVTIAVPQVFQDNPRVASLLISATLLLIMLAAPGGLARFVPDLARVLTRRIAQLRVTDALEPMARSADWPALETAGPPLASARSSPDSMRAVRPSFGGESDPEGGAAVRNTGPRKALLEVNGLSKHFGGVVANDNVSLTVYEHEIVGVIGPNGAGKTTLFNLISGSLKPTAGSIAFDGDDVTRQKLSRRAQRGIVRTFQAAVTFPDFTAGDNVLLAAEAAADGYTPDEVGLLLERVALTELRDRPARALTYGQQKVLGVAMALATRPRLLCLDEPIAGLSRQEATDLVALIADVRESGITILLIDHRVDVIAEVCDRFVVLDFGSKIAEGTVAEVRADLAVIEAYLGTWRE